MSCLDYDYCCLKILFKGLEIHAARMDALSSQQVPVAEACSRTSWAVTPCAHIAPHSAEVNSVGTCVMRWQKMLMRHAARSGDEACASRL